MTSDRPIDPFFGAVPERVQLTDAPLERVLARVTFPRIARIVREECISHFQDAIQAEYPIADKDAFQDLDIYVTKNEIDHQQNTSVIWRFFDEKKLFRVSLGPQFIILESAKYESRNDFFKRLSFILHSFVNKIEPSHVEEISFRYVNRVSEVNKLQKLVYPELLSMGGSGLTEKVEFAMTQVNSPTAEGNIVARYGIAPPNYSHDPTTVPTASEKSWVFDLESTSVAFIGEPFEIGTLQSELEKLASRAYAVFRWSVTSEFLKHYGGNLND